MVNRIGGISMPQQTGNSVADAGLKDTCKAFEALFLNYMLKASHSTTGGGGIFGDRHEGEMIRSMFEENLSTVVANGGGTGVGDLLYMQLRGKL